MGSKNEVRSEYGIIDCYTSRLEPTMANGVNKKWNE